MIGMYRARNYPGKDAIQFFENWGSLEFQPQSPVTTLR